MDRNIISLYLYTDMLKKLYLDEECNVMEIQNETGSGTSYNYKIFPGVEINYNDLHMKQGHETNKVFDNVIEINHCLDGRYECEFTGDTYTYVAAGDLAITSLMERKLSACFPLGYYQGITIIIDFNKISGQLNHIFELFTIDIDNIISQFTGVKNCHIMRADSSIEHVFSELYHVRGKKRFGYIKVKFFEILLYLSHLDFSREDQNFEYFPKKQVEKIKAIHDLIISDLQAHYTMQDLSDQFDISLTAIKKCFKGVYGEPIYTYLRKQRLQAAEKMLGDGSYNVSEVAELVGYDNPAKFASAFKSLKGITPKAFQKKN